jgi:hypothetical protein
MFAPNWSAKIEYHYYNFDSETLIGPLAGPPFVAGVDVDNDVHTIKLGVNYRFNFVSQNKELNIENAVRGWRLMAPRTSAEMEQTRRAIVTEAQRLPVDPSGKEIEKRS